jgi:hypothetical protein
MQNMSFSSASGMAVMVFASTNLIDWNAVGPASQITLGVYQYTVGLPGILQSDFTN